MTEIEIGRESFLKKIREGRERLDKMEEEMVEKNYKAEYEKLVSIIKDVQARAKQDMHDFPEPEWPDAINDRKEVIWFRNDVTDHAYAVGMASACSQILRAAEGS